MPNLIALGIYFIFGTKFSWMRGLILALMSSVYYLAVIFDFLGDYLVVTDLYLVVTAGYCSLPEGITGGYCSLPLVTACSHF